MNKPVFIDSNVIVYAYTEHTDPRHHKSKSILKEQCHFSKQALNEFSSILMGKYGQPKTAVEEAVHVLSAQAFVYSIQLSTTRLAFSLLEELSISFWDSMMIATALEHKGTTLLTEDLHHGQIVRDQLTIHNPFQETTP